jgi:hypothetical protein
MPLSPDVTGLPNGPGLPYEQRLQTDPRWAMSESTKFFEGSSGLHRTLQELTRRFDALGVGYVIIGGMALTAHGYARMTEDIDVLVTKPDLRRILSNLDGLGYQRIFEGSKNLRDTNTLVKIEFVLTGDYPGSGRPQPISFPSPGETHPVEHDGVKFIGLTGLVELKLASGMTGGADRAKDLIDVQQLIATLHLTRDLSNQLHEYVRPTYRDLWDGLHARKKKFVRRWPAAIQTLEAGSIEEMIKGLESAAEELRQMKADGIVLERAAATAGGYAHLVTSDPAIAEKYDLHEESEFFADDEDDGSPGSL